MNRPLPRLRDRKTLSLRSMIPNLVTLLALCAGLTSIRLAIEARFEMATVMILVAAALDGLDGRLARMLDSSSKIGAELDSLSDFISFGVAPVVVTYLWALSNVKGWGWTVVMFFAVCCAMRLARFNIMSREPDPPPYSDQFFVGVPAPGGAVLALLPLFAAHAGYPEVSDWGLAIAAYVTLIGVLMVSRVPTWSVKKVRISREWLIPFLLLVAFVAVMIFTQTWLVLIWLDLAYLASIPFAVMAQRRREKPPG